MLILKHVRNWSYEIVEREVRANVVDRSLFRVGMEKTLGFTPGFRVPSCKKHLPGREYMPITGCLERKIGWDDKKT